jgi:hypothetical protein
MFRVLFAPIIMSTTAAHGHRSRVVRHATALDQAPVWDSPTVKHGQLQCGLVCYYIGAGTGLGQLYSSAWSVTDCNCN